MVAAPIRLNFNSIPTITPSYLRAATTLTGGLTGDRTIPSIRAEVPALEARAENVVRYREVCGFPHASTLPVTYPHVLAFPLQMAVMTHSAFPLKLLGLIHVRNEITQQRAIDRDETLRLEVCVDGHRDVAKGVEFDLVTRVFDTADACIWRETGTMLSRSKRNHDAAGEGSRHPAHAEEAGFSPDHESEWQVPADIGRRYARVAGDYNPIHLSAWSAKIFGFPRAIATGMWMKARTAAALEAYVSEAACTLSVAFKKPVFLPGQVVFGHSRTNQGIDFSLWDAGDAEIVHLFGHIRYSASP